VIRPRDLGAALHEADWDSLHPQLVAHAEWRLRRAGWAAGKDHEPSALAVGQVIDTAIERCLEGRRNWSDACPDLEAFLKGVIDSIVWTAKKATIRARVDPAPDVGVDLVGEGPSAEDTLAVEKGSSAIRDAFEECARGDAALEDLYLAILEGNVERDEIAKALGWTGEQVSAAKIKLRRRLQSRFPEMFPKPAKGAGS
jgi:hypothetical protein